MPKTGTAPFFTNPDNAGMSNADTDTVTRDTAAPLYAQHLATLQQRLGQALARHGFDALAIAAGDERFAFLDDRPYGFQPNPHFVHWLPLAGALAAPGSWLLLQPGRCPQLLFLQPEDYWHAPPAAPAGYWVEAWQIDTFRDAATLLATLRERVQGLRVAHIAEAEAEGDAGLAAHNPQALLDHLHFDRAFKTAHELALMRQASRQAVRGHVAARAAFEGGASEAAIHSAYLVASGQAERELPYGNIIGIDEHAAVLHWQHQHKLAPTAPRTLLIDAGAACSGYAADITRTWLHPQAPAGAAREHFAALLAGMETLQLDLADRVRDGVDYVDIHLQAHHHIAALLLQTGLLHGLSAEAAVAQGLSSTFLPHGIGHLLGAQVHDVAGLQVDHAGTRRERPPGHPYLRLTRALGPGMVVTIEPGLYFIPMLLQRQRETATAAHVDWAAVDALLPFGGIRIEDNLACREQGAPENLTRDAFAARG